ncbi:MAG: 4Fe-4S dicluster domain-containing protein [Candidatus Omnitrophica bacterium]|nr:4Fe-4S dicluster domain-containing protein [Candidatus Omnitrophota bacterium]
MTHPKRPPIDSRWVLERKDFNGLFEALAGRGYAVIGPTVRDAAIVYEEIQSDQDLPEGWTDEQEAGRYRLKPRPDRKLFGYNVGPHSWKRWLNPPSVRLWRARREGGGFAVAPETERPPRVAFLGVRPCELRAIEIQDKVFMGGGYKDDIYKSRRDSLFIVAVQCGQAGGTCFCVSMKTGPKSNGGFDLALTEVLESGRHYFLLEVGTARGAEVAGEVACVPAGKHQRQAAEARVMEAVSQMGRTMDTSDLRGLFYRNAEHPRWEETAARCLLCANCTMACPTCFCTTVEDTTDLTGERAERRRTWDSCFSADFSYLHGGSVRFSPKSRYRQWITHKLAAWFDQFGTSGCVGCGRCITWCPAAIDITEEVRAIRKGDSGKKE